MSKHGWTYKKLGQMAKMYQPKTLSTQQLVENGNYLVYGANGVIGRYNEYNHEDSEILMTCRGATCGTINVSEPKSWINGNAMVIHPFNAKEVSQGYLVYGLTAVDKTKIITGLAQPQITRQNLKELIIPIPAMEEQEAIVAELDEINEAIAALRQQIADLDTLAQSTFYDMFGDPITNEKGWDVKPMGEVGELQRGSGLSKKDLIEIGFPCILYGQIHTRFGAYTRRHIACIPQDLVSTAKIAKFGDILMAITSEDVEGSCKSVAWMGDYEIAVGSDAAIFRHRLNPIYVSYYTQTTAFYAEKAKYAKGFKVTHISTKEIAKIPIPLPPLALQQEFAAKVEAIELAKAELNAQIADMQTLLASRMDYYFD